MILLKNVLNLFKNLEIIFDIYIFFFDRKGTTFFTIMCTKTQFSAYWEGKFGVFGYQVESVKGKEQYTVQSLVPQISFLLISAFKQIKLLYNLFPSTFFS